MSGTTEPRGASAAEIESEVERTRARVTDTIEALRDRMSPGQVVDQLVDYARDSGGAEFLRNLGTSVRDNPLPVALVGAGIGWLMLSGGRDRAAAEVRMPPRLLPPPDLSEVAARNRGGADGTARPGVRMSGPAGEVRDRAGAAAGAVGDAASGASDALREGASRASGALHDTASRAAGTVASAAGAVGDAASGVADRAADLAGAVAEAGSRAADGARRLYHDAADGVSDAAGAGTAGVGSLADRAGRQWDRMAGEQPLLLGALGLIVGAAVGALLPHSRAEDRLMGEASDSVAARVADAAREEYEGAKEAAGRHLGEAQDALADTYARSRETLSRDGVSTASVGSAVGSAAERLGKAAKDAIRDASEEVKSGIDAPDGKERQPEAGLDTPPRPAAPIGR